MNAPQFDINRIPLNPSDPGFMEAVVTEEKRVCGAIDDRLDKLVGEFGLLAKEALELAVKLQTTPGFFARWALRRRIKCITRRLRDNSTMRNELTSARLKRTYGA